jgi:ribosomal protein S27E
MFVSDNSRAGHKSGTGLVIFVESTAANRICVKNRESRKIREGMPATVPALLRCAILQVPFNLGTESSISRAVNATEELKFACPMCHQNLVCGSDAVGLQIECPTCFKTIVVPKSTSMTTTKLILQRRHIRARHSRPAERLHLQRLQRLAGFG